MTYQSHSFSIDDAIASSQETYDLDFTDWGYRPNLIANVDDNMRFPTPGKAAIPTTLAGISIGPKSTVDRCWVSWDRQKTLAVVDDSDPTPLTSDLRRLSLGTPLLYSQATNRGTLIYTTPFAIINEGTVAAMQRGLLYVFSYAFGDGEYVLSTDLGFQGDTTALPVEYVDQFGVNRPMSGVLDFESPFLHLVLNLRPGLFAPPVKRFPLMRTNKGSVLLANPKQRLALIPIYGRKHLRVQVVSRTNGAVLGRTCDFWVGLLRNMNESGVTNPNNPSPVFEVNAGTALAVAPAVPVEFAIDNPGADYLAIYCTTTVGNTSIIYTVVAED